MTEPTTQRRSAGAHRATFLPAAQQTRLAPGSLVLAGAMLLLAAGEPALSTSEAPAVVVARVSEQPFPFTIEALGTARANESVEIRPLVSQRIVAIRFEEGQRVEAGRVLVELQSAEARADVASARATLAESESQLRRTRTLYETKAVSASELEQRLTRRDADRAALDAAEARLADTRVRAPFAGVLGLRHVSIGSYATPNTVITTLDDTDTIKLDFEVPETVLARVVTGLAISARSAAWPEATFEGRVAAIDTRVDPVSRTLTVRALLPNDDGRLRPGMFLTVLLVRDDIRALVVPEAAIVPERSRQFVYVVDAEERIERREVRTGRRQPGWVEIIRGLAAGEVIVVEGTQKALPGQPVRVIGGGPPAAEALAGKEPLP
ncbi:MAG: efflux RND transporter periplasmic adaptor subunit [Deltaproteobacteria bacterium]|nr:efflux RND transporter periplasmic adaptor subunit [Deltaproteobacteria bacterium]MBW2385537.1 efflux RND transporter periplasmic adaptor subunit [Deltaproteobacteria bacterium]